jgi:hypothetical protein
LRNTYIAQYPYKQHKISHMAKFDALMPLRLFVINISGETDLRAKDDGHTVPINIPHCTKSGNGGRRAWEGTKPNFAKAKHPGVP